MVVLGISRDNSVIGWDAIVEGFDHTILESCHQGRGLEYRAGLGAESDRHVVGLVEAPVCGVPYEIDHRADRSGLDIH